MDNQIIKLNEDIDSFPLPQKIFHGKLLGITETIYLDTDIISLTEYKLNMFSPCEKIKYEFLIEQMHNKKKKYCKITIKEFSTYYNSEPVNRCKIELTYIPIEEMITLRRRTRYNCDGKIIRFKRNFKDDGLYRYDIYIDSEYIGFVSEFGNYEKYNKDACGIMNISLSNCSFLSVNKSFGAMKVSLALQNTYEQFIKNNFKLYLPKVNDIFFFKTILSLNTLSLSNYFIAGVSSNDEYYLIRDRIEPDDCSYLQVDVKTLTVVPVKIVNPCTSIFQSILATDYNIDNPILREFDTKHYLCDLSFNILRGFSLKKSRELDGFYSMSVINGKKSKFFIHSRKYV